MIQIPSFVARLMVGVLATSISLIPSASPAVAATMNPGDFTVSMTPVTPTMTNTMSCTFGASTVSVDPTGDTSSLLPLFQALVASDGSTRMNCTVTNVQMQTSVDLTGTVANSALNITGSMAQTCDLDQEVVTRMSYQKNGAIAEIVRNTFSVELNGFQSCSWAMSFTEGSRLAGTIKQTINVDPATGSISTSGQSSTYSTTARMEADVLIAGGAGQFASMAGTADFDRDFPITVGVPGTNISTLIRLFSGLAKQPVFATSGSGMTNMSLDNSKGGTVDFAIPAQTSASTYTLGNGADGTAQRIRLTTTPGAKCTITVKGNNKSATLLKNKKTASGELETTLTAATVAKKLKSTTAKMSGKSATMTATCTAGKKGKKVSKKITFTFADA